MGALALRSVLSTLMLMIILVYVFAIVFVQLLADTSARDKGFEDVLGAIYYLIATLAFPDQKPFLDNVLAADKFAFVLALICVALGTLTLMNMLLGAMVEIVSVVAR